MRFVLFFCFMAFTFSGCDSDNASEPGILEPLLPQPDGDDGPANQDGPVDPNGANPQQSDDITEPDEDEPADPNVVDDNQMEDPMPRDDSAGSNDDDDRDDLGEPMDRDDAPVFPVDDLIERIATATCEAMNHCCQGNEIESYWRSIANNPRFEEVADTLPPNAEYDPEGCTEQLSAAFEIAPFGGWVDAVRTGVVEYNADAADRCLETLANAECGEALNLALFDGTCFAFQAPVGAHRQAFERTSQIDDVCTALTDGTGGSFFGTCDPETSWCATVHADGRYGITTAGQQGVCVSAAGEGEQGGLFPSASGCQTGLNCNVDNVCERRIDPLPAQMDEPCYDAETYTLFGDCQTGFCDMLGTNTCQPLRDAEEACFSSFECASANCDNGVCSARVYCSGRD